MRTPPKRLPLLLALVAVTFTPMLANKAHAAADPAASQIESLDSSLIETMKAKPASG